MGVPYGSLSYEREATGLPRSVYVPQWVRLRLFADGRVVCDGKWHSPHTRPCTFWSEPVSIFGSPDLYDVYQRFTCVSHTTAS